MPKTNSTKAAEPITIAAVAAGATIVSAAFTTLGYFAQRAENRRIIGLLSQIKTYLHDLNNKIDKIKEQNDEILKKLDHLPSIIARLLREETLNEKYSELNAIQNNYFLLPNGQSRYLIHKEGWDTLSAVLTFIVKHEFRISKSFQIIQLCEFSLSATELLGTPIVSLLLTEKINAYESVKAELYENVMQSFNNLIVLFDNNNFIKEHNFGKNLEDLKDLSYTLQPDKPTVETYVHTEIMREHQTAPYTHRETRTRQSKEGIQFNNDKAIHIQQIQNELKHFEKRIYDYKEIRDVEKSFKFYLEMINEDFAKQITKPVFVDKAPESFGLFIQKD